MEKPETGKAKTSMTKNKLEGLTLRDFKTNNKAAIIKTVG